MHFLRWYWLQGEAQILMFLKHWQTTTQISTTLRIAVSWYQYHSGVGFPLFETPDVPITYTPSRWLHSCRTFLSTNHFAQNVIYFSNEFEPCCETRSRLLARTSVLGLVHALRIDTFPLVQVNLSLTSTMRALHST